MLYLNSWNAIDKPSVGSWAQTNEDLVCAEIFSYIGTTNEYLVDLGAGDGSNLSNSRYFLEKGWTGLLVEGSGPHVGVEQHWIRADTICHYLNKQGVPKAFDLLSLDIDGQDLWVLSAILRNRYRPRVMVCEYNASKRESVSVPQDPQFVHDGTDYYGASLEAFRRVCARHDYTLVHNHWYRNLFFIQSDIIPGVQPEVSVELRNYHHPDKQKRKWVTV